jgi:ADP-ribose pyrophosphatase YjhB (NUDIX family)
VTIDDAQLVATCADVGHRSRMWHQSFAALQAAQQEPCLDPGILAKRRRFDFSSNQTSGLSPAHRARLCQV